MGGRRWFLGRWCRFSDRGSELFSSRGTEIFFLFPPAVRESTVCTIVPRGIKARETKRGGFNKRRKNARRREEEVERAHARGNKIFANELPPNWTVVAETRYAPVLLSFSLHPSSHPFLFHLLIETRTLRADILFLPSIENFAEMHK